MLRWQASKLQGVPKVRRQIQFEFAPLFVVEFGCCWCYLKAPSFLFRMVYYLPLYLFYIAILG